VRFLRTKEQKDNLAKSCWDLFKITIAALVIAPCTKPETVDFRSLVLGLSIRDILCCAWLYFGWHGGAIMTPLNPLEMVFVGLFVLAVIIGLIIFFDKGLKWKGKD
jgi:hypothetical protein